MGRRTVCNGRDQSIHRDWAVEYHARGHRLLAHEVATTDVSHLR